jgi:hypothetical protein
MVSSTTLLVDIHGVNLTHRLTDAHTIHAIIKTICLHRNFDIVSSSIHLFPDTSAVDVRVQTNACSITITTHPAHHHALFWLHSFDPIDTTALFEIYEFLTLAFDAPYKSEYINIANTFAPDPEPAALIP